MSDDERIGHWYALAYVIVGAPLLFAMVFLLRPFGAPDEVWHFRKAVSVASGYLLPVVVEKQTPAGPRKWAGTPIDTAADRVSLAGQHLGSGPPVASADIADLRRVRASGTARFAYFDNTAIYLPFFYGAAAAGIAVAHLMDLPVLDWLYVARLANAALWLVAALYAIRSAGRRAPLIFCLASLPIVLQQVASVSNDGPLFAATLMFGVLVARLSDGKLGGGGALALLAALTIVIGSGKIGFLLFALLPVFVAMDHGRWTRGRLVNRPVAALAGAAVVAVVVWGAWAFVIRHSVLFYQEGVVVSPGDQIAWALAHPLRFVGVMGRAWVTGIPPALMQSVGRKLGALSVAVPQAACVLALAGLLSCALTTSPDPDRRRAPFLIAAALAIASYCVIYLLLFLQFNGVGSEHVGGFQGRYVTPMLMIVLPLVPAMGRGRRAWVAPAAVAVAIWCFGALGLLLVARDGWA